MSNVILKCLKCHYGFDRAVVRYYSDEMREEKLMCPHCQNLHFEEINKQEEKRSV